MSDKNTLKLISVLLLQSLADNRNKILFVYDTKIINDNAIRILDDLNNIKLHQFSTPQNLKEFLDNNKNDKCILYIDDLDIMKCESNLDQSYFSLEYPDKEFILPISSLDNLRNVEHTNMYFYYPGICDTMVDLLNGTDTNSIHVIVYSNNTTTENSNLDKVKTDLIQKAQDNDDVTETEDNYTAINIDNKNIYIAGLNIDEASQSEILNNWIVNGTFDTVNLYYIGQNSDILFSKNYINNDKVTINLLFYPNEDSLTSITNFKSNASANQIPINIIHPTKSVLSHGSDSNVITNLLNSLKEDYSHNTTPGISVIEQLISIEWDILKKCGIIKKKIEGNYAYDENNSYLEEFDLNFLN